MCFAFTSSSEGGAPWCMAKIRAKTLRSKEHEPSESVTPLLPSSVSTLLFQTLCEMCVACVFKACSVSGSVQENTSSPQMETLNLCHVGRKAGLLFEIMFGIDPWGKKNK